jgi:hypothetical protein
MVIYAEKLNLYTNVAGSFFADQKTAAVRKLKNYLADTFIKENH